MSYQMRKSKKLSSEQTYNFIVEYVSEHGYPPTVREIQEMLGLSSPSRIKYILDILKKEGLISSDEESYSHRAYRVVGLRFVSEGYIRNLEQSH